LLLSCGATGSSVFDIDACSILNVLTRPRKFLPVLTGPSVERWKNRASPCFYRSSVGVQHFFRRICFFSDDPV
jgi:hypothetical protein